MQAVFFGLCVLVDVIHIVVPVKQTRSGTPLTLTKARDFYFTVLAFPVGTVSSTKVFFYDTPTLMLYQTFMIDFIPQKMSFFLSIPGHSFQYSSKE